MLRTRLQTLGVLRQATGHEHLNGCLVFPLTDLTGQVVQLCGYRLAQSVASDSLFLPGGNRGLWNASGLTARGDWLICSDLLDALTLLVPRAPANDRNHWLQT